MESFFVYSILISIGIGVAVGVLYTLLGFWKTWGMGIILAVLIGLTCFVLISRMLARRFEPRFLQAQKQLQSGATQLAMKTLEQLLPLSRWQVMLRGQIYAQMGILAYAAENEDTALQHLEKSSLRAPDARMALAAIYFRRKNFSEAYDTMEVAIRGNKKQILPYHAYAWMLNRSDEREKAIEQLRRALKVEKSNEASKDNLLRLQNNRKLSMKRFGMQWYALKLEKPPASMRQYQPGTHRGMRTRQRKQKRRG
jgi:tetratricopeptide (TPR) repeat protein